MTASILDLWLKGVKLSQSPYKFSSSADKEEYARLHQVSKDKIFMQAYKSAESAGLNPIDRLRAGAEKVGPVTSARTELQQRMQNLVQKHLKLGNLYGYGFEPPRKIHSQPFEIPAYCWTGHIQWSHDVLTADGLEFAHIRLLTANERHNLTASKIEVASAGKPGRPGIKEDVKEAFDHLVASDAIDTSIAAKRHFQAVRNWLRTNKPEAGYTENTPSDEGIRAHFSSHFNALKKNSKQ